MNSLHSGGGLGINIFFKAPSDSHMGLTLGITDLVLASHFISQKTEVAERGRALLQITEPIADQKAREPVFAI